MRLPWRIRPPGCQTCLRPFTLIELQKRKQKAAETALAQPPQPGETSVTTYL
jgi:hypothetical protein